jgi:cytochrome c-type biogenesis protein CcmH
MAVVVAGVLVVGLRPVGSPTLDQRVTSLASQVRCPVCDGETAAESDTPPSVEIRALIRQWMQSGESNAQIKANLVDDYGTGILEAPPARGIDLIVWVLPVAVFVIAVAGLALAFRGWRARQRTGGRPSDDDRDRVQRALANDPGPSR